MRYGKILRLMYYVSLEVILLIAPNCSVFRFNTVFGRHLPQCWRDLLPTLKPSRLHRFKFKKTWTFSLDREKAYNIGRSIADLKY